MIIPMLQKRQDRNQRFGQSGHGCKNDCEVDQEGGRGATASRQRAQSFLVVVEIVMTLVLLAGAGLMIRSLAALWNVNPGFQANNILTFGLALPPSSGIT